MKNEQYTGQEKRKQSNVEYSGKKRRKSDCQECGNADTKWDMEEFYCPKCGLVFR